MAAAQYHAQRKRSTDVYKRQPLPCPACNTASDIISILTLFDVKDESLRHFRYMQNLWQKRASMTVICARVAVPVGFSVVGVVPAMMPFA